MYQSELRIPLGITVCAWGTGTGATAAVAIWFVQQLVLRDYTVHTARRTAVFTNFRIWMRVWAYNVSS